MFPLGKTFFRFKIKWLTLVVGMSHAFAQNDQVFNIQSFGAKPVKDSVSTRYIQAAIDACGKSGGGVVYFPPGEYTSGQLYLKNNVELKIEAGATLYASRNPAHYKEQVKGYEADNQQATPNELALIFADGLSRIAVTGRGIIHGNARREWDKLRKVDKFIEEETEIARKSGVEMSRFYAMDPKVRIIYINKCHDVLIEDISVLESPDWNVHLGVCERANIRGIYVYSSLDEGVNSDGIDIDGCRDVRISDCTVNTGDDAICLKSTNKNGEYHNCENIVVNNCTLVSSSTALKLGTESHGDFKHILFNNCSIRNSNRGISIVVRDGANVSDIVFSNLTIECNRKHFNWWGDADPIRFIVLKRTPESRIGSIKNVLIQNVTAHGQGTSLMQGFEGHPLENIRLDNVFLTVESESKPDKRATYGLKIKEVKNLKINHSDIIWDTDKGIGPKWLSALLLENVSHSVINTLSCRQPGDKGTAIEVRDASNVVFRNTMALPGTDVLYSIAGSKSGTVDIISPYFKQGVTLLLVGSEVPKGMVKVLK